MLKRIGLFALVNLGVMITVIAVTNLLGIRHYLTAYGIDYRALMGFCLVYGMVGSLASLFLSKTMAKWMMSLHIVDPGGAGSPLERHLLDTVRRLSSLAGLSTLPEVAIYESPEINAFATGPSKNNSLVAVSTGLLNTMSEQELEGVLAHEIAHITNGDMVTMTLIQGVVNAFVMFFAKAMAWIVAQALSQNSNDRERSGSPSFFVVWILESLFYVVFGLVGSIVVAWFSRYREFRADRGGANIAGTTKMVAALQRLKNNLEAPSHGGFQREVDGIASLKISGLPSFLELLSTHPSLDSRIERLRSL